MIQAMAPTREHPTQLTIIGKIMYIIYLVSDLMRVYVQITVVFIG